MIFVSIPDGYMKAIHIITSYLSALIRMEKNALPAREELQLILKAMLQEAIRSIPLHFLLILKVKEYIFLNPR